MKESPENRLREAGWRRPLTSAEEAELRAWLATHPEARDDWQAEAALTTALQELADAPLPSNLTARVLQEIERERLATEPPRAGLWHSVAWRRWLPRAVLPVCVAVVVLVASQVRHAVARAELGQSLVAIASVTAAPSPDTLKDFEAIKRLHVAPAPDKELLSLLQ